MKKQNKTLKSILEGVNGTIDTSVIIWKALIYDNETQEMLSTSVKLGEIRQMNYTMHMKIKEVKSALLSVNIIYLIAPTIENIELIHEHCRQGYFDNIYINFTSPASKELLTSLSTKLDKEVFRIKKIFQHNLRYNVLSKNLFSFNNINCFSELNQGQPDKILEQSAISLISLFKSCKKLPKIFYNKSQKMGKFLDILEEKYYESFNFEEPGAKEIKDDSIILIMEREFDISVALHHSFQYLSILAETCNLKNNQISLKNEQYDLDMKQDNFWSTYMNEEFLPIVGTAITEEIRNMTKDIENMPHRSQTNANIEEMNKNLETAMDALPEIALRKKFNQMHSTLIDYSIKEMQKRSLDKLHQVELDLINNSDITDNDYKEFLNKFLEEDTKDDAIKSLDKLRLAVIFIENKSSIQKSEALSLRNQISSNSKLSA